jgi:hypothetical protein
MKYLIAILCLISSVVSSSCEINETRATASSEMPVVEPAKGDKQAVLVELFTSEGCSSCPPADRLLIDISTKQPYKDAEVITLGFHVDYWDHIGWKDRFSSREFTKRQEDYSRQFRLDSTYTPQIVVDGEREVVGNNRQGVDEAVTKSRSEKADVRLEVKDDQLSINIDKLAAQKGSTVYLAVAESGLRSAVSSGENSGRNLDHVSVVRELRSLGKIEAGKNVYTAQVKLPSSGDWKRDSLRYVVFVQDDANMKIHGVAAIGR